MKKRRSDSEKYIKNAKNNFLTGIGEPEKSDFIVDDFQKQAINYIAKDEDTLVVAPTGSGKTFIAIEAIQIALQTNTRAIYTTPLKALSNTKYSDFKKRFEPKHKVGLLTGDRKIDTDAQVVIATTEIYRNELYEKPADYSVVILDEVHFISEPHRGPVWEESIILSSTDSTLLMLSASISNAEEIAEWISGLRKKPCRVVREEKRPVELRFGFLEPKLGVLPLSNKKDRLFSSVGNYYEGLKLDRSGTRLRKERRERRSNYPKRKR